MDCYCSQDFDCPVVNEVEGRECKMRDCEAMKGEGKGKEQKDRNIADLQILHPPFYKTYNACVHKG